MDCCSRKPLLRYVLIACLSIYLFSAKGYVEVSDTFYSVQTAQAIVDHWSLDIPYAEGTTLKAKDGRSYSKYGLGLPLYYVPFVAASNTLSRRIGLPAQDVTNFLISFANIPFAMISLVIFARLLTMLNVTGVSAWLTPLWLGLGTLTWKYAGYDYSEVMQMALLLLAVYGTIRGTPKSLLLGGFGFAWLFFVKLVYVVFFPIFLAYVIAGPRSNRQKLRDILRFSLPFFFAGALLALFNTVRFGNPLESGYGGEASLFYPSQLWFTIPRLLWSLDKGLFIFCPIMILAVFCWLELASRHRKEALLCGAVVISNLLVAGTWHSWVGGWSWGPRLLVPSIPLWLLPAAFMFSKLRSRLHIAIFVLLTIASILLQIPGVLVKDQEIHHIKDVMLTAEERQWVTSDYVMAYRLLSHKLANENEVYRVSEFGVPGNRELDLTKYRTFNGLNIWTEQVARQMHRPELRRLPILLLVLIICLSVKATRDLTATRSSRDRCSDF